METLFKSLVLSHQKAPVAIRELFALDETSVRGLLHYLSQLSLTDNSEGIASDITDLLVVSTCNRTEVYYCSPVDQTAAIINGLLAQKGLDGRLDYLDYFTAITDPNEAIRHLFRVAVGLESREVGDGQVYQQVKRAYELTVEQDLAEPFLHRLMHSIFFTHKRIVQETTFREGATSVARVAAELADKLVGGSAFAKKNKPIILVLGLGEIGADVCHYLSEMPHASIWVSNRTASKAEKMAADYGFHTIPFELLPQAMESVDVVISSVCLEEPLITKDMLAQERLRYQYFIDLSVPRSVHANLEELPGVVVYNIDDLCQKTSDAFEKRLAAIPHVERILWESMEQFNEWASELVVSPLIAGLKNALETIRQEEMARYRKKMSPDEVKRADTLTKSMTQKILKMPVLQLKAACKRGEATALIAVLRDLFELEKPASESVPEKSDVQVPPNTLNHSVYELMSVIR